MLKRALTALALPLASCGGFTAPARDNAQWTTTLHGTTITWRWTEPGVLEREYGPGAAGHTQNRAGYQPLSTQENAASLPRVAALRSAG